MNEKMMVFEGIEVTIEVINGVPMFEIYSTGMAIGYINKAKGKDYPHKSRIDTTVKNADISTVVHGVQQYMSQSQMYDFILEAHTEKCKRFRKWVTGTVLPSIQETGGYVQGSKAKEFINSYFPSLTEGTKKALVTELQNTIEQKDKLIAELEIQAQMAKDLLTAEGYITVGEASAIVEKGRNKLFDFLRQCKVLTKQSKYNLPYGRFMTNGCFTVISEVNKGHISSVTMVSPKGLAYIYKLIRKNGVMDEFDTTSLVGGIN